jgi:hypothetical protein
LIDWLIDWLIFILFSSCMGKLCILFISGHANLFLLKLAGYILWSYNIVHPSLAWRFHFS